VVQDLRTERVATSPTFVDTATPRLSWTLGVPSGSAAIAGAVQSAYRIVAATTAQAAVNAARLGSTHGADVVWDSGAVTSNATLWIPYGGTGLQSPGDAVFWTVQVTDGDGMQCDVPAAVAVVKAPAAGVASDWAGAQWIVRDNVVPDSDCGFYVDDPAPLLRKSFTLPPAATVRSASLFITGLGFYTAALNGVPVSAASASSTDEGYPLDPAWTSYGRRVLFSGFNVTGLVNWGASGSNALAITLGKG